MRQRSGKGINGRVIITLQQGNLPQAIQGCRLQPGGIHDLFKCCLRPFQFVEIKQDVSKPQREGLVTGL